MCGVVEGAKRGGDGGARGHRSAKQAKLTVCWTAGKRPAGQTRISDFFGSVCTVGQTQFGGKRPPAHLVGAVKRPKKVSAVLRVGAHGPTP